MPAISDPEPYNAADNIDKIATSYNNNVDLVSVHNIELRDDINKQEAMIIDEKERSLKMSK